MSEFKYLGAELELFAVVRNWKTYWSNQIRPYIAGDVLEVGAGIGANTQYLNRGNARRWVCLEPDPLLAAQLSSKLEQTKIQSTYEVVCGTLQTLQDEQFDTIIYIDVLEHIEDDERGAGASGRAFAAGGPDDCFIARAPRPVYRVRRCDRSFRRYDRRMCRAFLRPS